MADHGVELRAASLADTHRVAAAVAAVFRAGDIVVLAGEMGAGKTAFAQGVGRALGITEPVTSPTFTLVHSYPVPESAGRGRFTLHHADLYRLDRTAEVADLALNELAEDRGAVLIEWGDVVDTMFGDHLLVHLDADLDDDDLDAGPTDDGATDDSADDFGLDAGRLITLAASGGAWAGRWQALIAGMEDLRC